ncbi:MAG: hypothetical protein J6V21_00745 [Alistipes sp.]|nr:hypothetical protein [Alistipes sp.]
MEDWVKFVSAIIERIGFISAVIATIASIIFYKLFVVDLLWTIVVGCTTYIIVLCIVKLVKFFKRCFTLYNECRSRRLQSYWFYETLSDGIKTSLRELYKMPQKQHKYCRIVAEDCDINRQIIYDCKYIQRHTEDYNLIIISEGLGSDRYTIIIDEFLYDVIRKNN